MCLPLCARVLATLGCTSPLGARLPQSHCSSLAGQLGGEAVEQALVRAGGSLPLLLQRCVFGGCSLLGALATPGLMPPWQLALLSLAAEGEHELLSRLLCEPSSVCWRSNRKAELSYRWAARPSSPVPAWAGSMGPCPQNEAGGPHHAPNPPGFPPDEKEESILGSIPLLSFRVAAVQPSDNISRKHTFKVSARARGLGGPRDGAGAAAMLAGSPLRPPLASLVLVRGAEPSRGEGGLR